MKVIEKYRFSGQWIAVAELVDGLHLMSTQKIDTEWTDLGVVHPEMTIPAAAFKQAKGRVEESDLRQVGIGPLTIEYQYYQVTGQSWRGGADTWYYQVPLRVIGIAQ